MKKQILAIGFTCLFSAHALSWKEKHDFSYKNGTLEPSWKGSRLDKEDIQGGKVYHGSSKPERFEKMGASTVHSSFGLNSGGLVLFGKVSKTNYDQYSQAVDNGFSFKMYDKNNNGEVSFIHCYGHGKYGPGRAVTNCKINSPKICEQIGLLKHTSDKWAKAKEISREMRKVYDSLRKKINSQAKSISHIRPLKDLNFLLQADASITEDPNHIADVANSCGDKKLFPPAKSEKKSWWGSRVSGE